MNTAPNLALQELDELIGLVNKVYGFDFSGYSKASLKRRMIRVMQNKKFSWDDLKLTLITDPNYFPEFLDEITVNVTEMFRDPSFYQSLNSQVIPYFSNHQRIKIWSAGCSSGEEVYSLAILLKENGLGQKSYILGTDINSEMLKKANKGVYGLKKVKTYDENYKHSGLKGALTDHYTINNDIAVIHSEIKHNIQFTVHNLVSGQILNSFDLITCRNVFIYFETKLQERILELFYNSLSPSGFLCMGSKETIRSDEFKKKFRVINNKENIYQKITA